MATKLAGSSNLKLLLDQKKVSDGFWHSLVLTRHAKEVSAVTLDYKEFTT